jgi:predicted ATPase/class 3 adenylate cyclase/DNA-binding SARP family transcriptional activator
VTGPDRTAAPLSLSLFGPFEVSLNGVDLPRLRTRKGQWLLALLALRHDTDVKRAWLAGTLWPDSPDSFALASLRKSLTDLRRALGPEAGRLRSPTPDSLSLDLADAAVDVVAFDAAIAQGDPPALEQAVALYRGPLLEGWVEEWVFQERQAREQAYLQALESLAGRAMTRGDTGAAERCLRLAVGVDPLRESTQRALMQLLAAGGNYAAATLAYRELRLHLHRKVNVEPDAETQALFRQLRADARGKAGAGGPESGVTEVRGSGPGALDRAAAGTDPRPTLRRSAPVPDPSGTFTFLFTDIEGSTRLWEEHPEAMRAALARHDRLLRDAIETQDGHLFKTMGDQCCAAFATAPSALAAALAAQRELVGERDELRVRMALHTGTAEHRDGDYLGPSLNRVARLLAVGHGGQILLSQSVYDLVRDHLPDEVSLRDLGEHRLKDLARPEHLFQIVSPELPADFPPLKTIDSRPHNLPALTTPLIGRDREETAAQELLLREAVRLVTLTGPGGTGKTRLGLRVAGDLLDAFPDGVFFVDLAPIIDQGLVATTIAQTLGLREIGNLPAPARLKEHLREKRLLLLLDNFEQVVAAAPLVAELLEACSRLKVLVTSRTVLRLRGEHELPVPPLALPPVVDGRVPAKRVELVADGPTRSRTDGPPSSRSTSNDQRTTISQYAAVALFIDRALAARPDFTITSENASAVAGICCRLDGLPLAIELAAARIKLLPPHALLGRLESRLKLLTGGARDLPKRQQTLRGAVDWSYDLLNEGERSLFRRLSVFVGGCTLEAAETVGSGHETLDLLTSLVDKSLLRRVEQANGEPRFAMLETIREYGREQLEANGETAATRRQHAQFFLELAESAEAELIGPDQADWLGRLEMEHDNLRAGLAWSLEEGEIEAGLELGAVLRKFWEVRGHLSEGRGWLDELLTRSTDAATAARAKALTAAGRLAWFQSDYSAGRSLLEKGLEIARKLENRKDIAYALLSLGFVTLFQGDSIVSRACQEEGLSLYRELEDQSGIASALFLQGHLAKTRHDLTAARSHYEEGLALFRQLRDKESLAWLLANLGSVVHDQGDSDAAGRLCDESLAIFRELGDKWGIACSLHTLGEWARLREDTAAARANFEESLLLHQELGDKWGIARSLYSLADMADDGGDLPTAYRLFEKCLDIHRETGNRESAALAANALAGVAQRQGDWGVAEALGKENLAVSREIGQKTVIASSLLHLGNGARARGEREVARACYHESLTAWRELDHKGGIATSLEAFGALLDQEQPVRAARLFGAAAGLREALGTRGRPVRLPAYSSSVVSVRTALGEEAFATAWAEGQEMPLDDAMKYALEETAPI